MLYAHKMCEIFLHYAFAHSMLSLCNDWPSNMATILPNFSAYAAQGILQSAHKFTANDKFSMKVFSNHQANLAKMKLGNNLTSNFRISSAIKIMEPMANGIKKL